MQLTQIRNATLIIEMGDQVILVDPMLAPQGAIPSLKYWTPTRRRNPLVELPPGTSEALERVTACLITHCQKGHFDHLDRAGVRWLREQSIPVYCPQPDADYLAAKGLQVVALEPESTHCVLDMEIDLIPCLHGRGTVGRFMAHGYGFYLRHRGEPTLYLAGDTVLSDTVIKFVEDRQPDISVIPAGGARFDLGSELIMDLEQALQFAALAQGTVVANHLEALDHCPVRRQDLREAICRKGWQSRLLVPKDGEALHFSIAAQVA